MRKLLLAATALLLSGLAQAQIVAPAPTGYAGRTRINIDGISVSDATQNGGNKVAADCQDLQGAFTATSGQPSITFAAGSFVAADAGKGVEIEVFGPFNASTIFVGTIASVQSPTQITLSGNFTKTLAAWVGRLRYGTDNTQAIIAAGNSAIAAGKRFLMFRDGMTCAFGMGTATDAPAVGNLIWVGSNSTGYFTDTSGNALTKIIVPANAPPPPPPPKLIFGTASFPRASSVTSPCVMVWGDSLGADPPNAGFSQTESPIYYFMSALHRANPSRSFPYFNRAIGGASFPWMISVPPGPTWPAWYLNHTTAWATYAQQACGASTSPDIVALMENGGNDASVIWPEGVLATIQTIKGWPTVNGLAPDVVMNTGRNASLVASGSFNTYGSPTAQWSREYAYMLLRSIAQVNGIPLLDYEPQAMAVRNGWDPTRQSLVKMPTASEANASTAAPFNTGYRVRDFDSTVLLKGGTTDSAIWTNWGHVLHQVGARSDNILDLSLDGSGNVQYQVNTWGNRSVLMPNPANATVTVSGTALSVAAASTLTTTIAAGSASNIITLGSVAGLTAGNAILIPTGQYAGVDGGVFRSWIVSISGLNVTLSDNLPAIPDGASHTLSYGPLLFVGTDAVAKADIQVPGAGSASGLYVGQICGYTGATQATLCVAATTPLTSQSKAVFLGRISVPLTSSAVLGADTSCLNSLLGVSVKDITLSVNYDPCPSTALTPSVTTSLGSPTLINVAAGLFTSNFLGRQITVTGIGAAGGLYTGNVTAINSTTQVAVTPNIGTAVTGVAETLTVTASPSQIYRGPIERAGGPFVALIAPTNTSPGTTAHVTPNTNSGFWVDAPIPSMPVLTDLEMWGTIFSSPPCTYIYCGNGLAHPTTTQVAAVDAALLRQQDLGLTANYANAFGTTTPIDGFTYAIPANQSLTAMTPAGTLASGTVTLPSTFPQGGRLDITSTQTVTALTVSAPSGYSLSGASVTTISANGTLSYRLEGTTYYRVQ